MKTILLHKGTIVTAQKEAVGSILITGDRIAEVIYSDNDGFEERINDIRESHPELEIHDIEGKHVMAGGIDAHVHFREPGLTHKADMETESRAAAAGGVTSVIDMPNTKPPTVTPEDLAAKIKAANGRTMVNIGFHIGATNGNVRTIRRMLEEECEGLSSSSVGGVKVFMGSSTGNMLVDDISSLEGLFSISERPVLVHCEDEDIIKSNLEAAVRKYGEDIPFHEHENIRSRRACIKSSIKALEMAMKYRTRLTLCHISTKEELEMARAAKMTNPGIVAETSCNYLWFSDEDYERLGSRLKCNPSVKTPGDRDALIEGLRNGTIDTIGSDHAPHLVSEKAGHYTEVPSGIPSIQQSLPVLLTIASREDIPLSRIASVFSEKASEIYGMKRGKIRCGYAADLVVFDKGKEFKVKAEDQYSRCGWTPYEGEMLRGAIDTVYVNGEAVVRNGKVTGTAPAGKALRFGNSF